IYEMKYCERVPNAVAINEAVELAKKYSLKTDSGFINGILNSYMRELENNG
ncbi:MAG: transcription antitermination protein NusB, partial [Oscillospiraceae bacterium]|nr:transcription antitermination protein NusB [Oscillospiraceae bacterium]